MTAKLGLVRRLGYDGRVDSSECETLLLPVSPDGSELFTGNQPIP
jgi:hypothetical protein